METASFPEEERRGKDIVDSGTGFVKSENLVAPHKKTAPFQERLCINF